MFCGFGDRRRVDDCCDHGRVDGCGDHGRVDDCGSSCGDHSRVDALLVGRGGGRGDGSGEDRGLSFCCCGAGSGEHGRVDALVGGWRGDSSGDRGVRGDCDRGDRSSSNSLVHARRGVAKGETAALSRRGTVNRL